MSRSGAIVAAAALLGLFWWMAVSVSPTHSVVADEIAHVTAGYSYWSHNDYRLQPENGNFPQRWAALPLKAIGVRYPTTHQAAWESSDVWEIGYQFFYESGNPLPAMLWAARAMVALLGVICGIVVFSWSRSLFGQAGAVVSTAVFAFCPNLLAHGGLATSDMAASLAFLLATLAFWRLLHRVSTGRILAAGSALGFLCLCKFSAPVIVPVAALMACVRAWRGGPLPFRFGSLSGRVRGARAALLAAAGFTGAAGAAVLVIWAAYGFRYSIFSPDQPAGKLAFDWSAVLLQSPPTGPYSELERTLLKPGLIQATVGVARDHHLLPEGWLYGFAHVCRFSLWRPAFLLGHYRTTGWIAFFPVAFLLKTPLPVFGLLGLAGYAVARSRIRFRGLAYRLAPLGILFSVYWAFALSTHLDIGLRHVLPTYPPLYIFAGAASLLFPSRRWTAVTLCLLGLEAGGSMAARPDYLAYFNPILGGPSHAYRQLIDSSLDWGQDLPGLKHWLDLNTKPDDPVFLAYFGSGSPLYEGIHATRIADGFFDMRSRVLLPSMTGGTYCISATLYQQVYTRVRHGWTQDHERRYQALERWLGQSKITGLDTSTGPDGLPIPKTELIDKMHLVEDLRFGRLCRFLNDREPDDNIGHSILIFRLTDTEVRRFLFGPPPPFSK